MRRWLTVLVFFCPSLAVLAYNLDGNRWPSGQATFHVNIPGTSPSGTTWNAAFEDAMAQWSDETDFTYLVSPTYVDPCEGFNANMDGEGFPDGSGDTLNGTDFADDVCGNAFGESVLALTLSIAQPGNLGFALIDQTDIVFNNAFTWDVYTGPQREDVDFRRVALHELGHALGLGHENSEPAMMAPSIGDLDSLQVDDIAGANSLYGGPGDCDIIDLPVNSVVEDALEDGDCAVLELYGGGDDTSFVDTYRLTLDKETPLNILMESSSLDSVLLVTDEKLGGVDFDDDSGGNCNALINGIFPAGEYLLLANTYVEPFKCQGNTGAYKISISDSVLPMLSHASSVSGDSSNSIFHGGATSDGITYKSSFLTSDSITLNASIQPDPVHVGDSASMYIVILLSSGEKLAKTASGKFTLIPKLSGVPAAVHTDSLKPLESLAVFSNLKPEKFGVSNLTVNVFVGYALDSAPGEIYFNGSPISFSIN